MDFFFGKKAAAPAPAPPAEPPKQPVDQLKEWQRNLKTEARHLDRNIRELDRSEQKIQDEIRKAAKRSDQTSMRILAKEVVGARKAKDRIRTSQAQMNSVSMQLGEQMGMVKVAGAFAKSTEVMKAIGKLVKVPEIQQTMLNLQREMAKAGMISEMVDDAMDAVDGEGVEEAADEEIERVVAEITAGQFGSMAAAPTGRIGAPAAAAPARAAAAPRARVAVAAGGAGTADASDAKLDDLARSFEALG